MPTLPVIRQWIERPGVRRELEGLTLHWCFRFSVDAVQEPPFGIARVWFRVFDGIKKVAGHQHNLLSTSPLYVSPSCVSGIPLEVPEYAS